MAKDFPWFGSGPGTFGALFQVYRHDARLRRQSYAHNDWLETQVTFGRLGSGLVFAGLALAVLPPLVRRGVRLRGAFPGLVATAFAGCLVHARFDYPFQVHSIAFAFLVLVAASVIGSAQK
jgi:O-antigen ligase